MRALPRPGVRRRVAASFALGALLVAVFVAVTTYTLASGYLWSQRESTTVRQAGFDARVVAASLPTGAEGLDDLLRRLDASGQGSSPLVLWRGRWYDAGYPPGVDALPAAFVEAASEGRAVLQRTRVGGEVVVAIAVPVPEGTYVEVFPLTELDATLGTLAGVLVATTTVATALGAALGWWASARALRPLTAVTAAAGAIAAGDLDARLGHRGDPDLDPIAEAFDRTATRLQARVERDARFAADVSHELRSPLTTMLNASEILRTRRAGMDEETREVVDLLADDVGRFATMVTDLLELSLVDTGTAAAPTPVVDVVPVVARAAERGAGRPVPLSTGTGPATVRADPRRIERVVENLVRNAESHGRGVTGVHVVVDPSAALVRVMVDDDGPGVSPQDRERVFDRFARVGGTPSPSGVGLGLAIVAEHVRAHGGTTEVTDAPAGGARFVVTLPWVEP